MPFGISAKSLRGLRQRQDERSKTHNLLGQKRLEFEGISEPGGQLKTPFSMLQQQPGEFETALQQRARATGLSPEAQQEQQRQLESAQKGGLGLQAQTEEQLAMRGGLGGGARERLAEAGSEQLALQEQGIRGQIGAQDVEQRLGLQQRLGGLEAERGRSDIEAARDEQARKQEFGLRQFEKESEAIAAQRSAKEQARAACFIAGTLIDLSDGSKKPIEEIDIKDELSHGGFVYGCGKSIGNEFYNYNDIIVTGSHAVYEDGYWIRVRDSRIANPVPEPIDNTVHMIACENHTHIINGILFSDYDEIDEGQSVSDNERLELKNKREFLEVV